MRHSHLSWRSCQNSSRAQTDQATISMLIMSPVAAVACRQKFMVSPSAKAAMSGASQASRPAVTGPSRSGCQERRSGERSAGQSCTARASNPSTPAASSVLPTFRASGRQASGSRCKGNSKKDSSGCCSMGRQSQPQTRSRRSVLATVARGGRVKR